jgi:chromosome segregation ATPase
LKSTTGGAEGQTYSLLQLTSHADLARSEVVTLVKKLAREQHSAALNQLASRIQAVMRYGAAAGSDPFAKIKGLIADMIAKLESEASSEATEKAYCDDELSKTNAKKSELDTEIAKLTTKIDRASAHSSALKGEVAGLQAELSTMEKEQADNTKWREDEHAEYLVAKADLEQGLSGVRRALEVLRSYYGGAAFVQQPAKPEIHDQATGAGQSIVGVLEVVESDFADNLAKVETEESDSQSTYETLTQDYKLSKAQKDQDVKYKTQEFTGLDKSISDLSSDRATANEEVSAVNEYLSKLKDRCIAKPETYEERKNRRDAEINGLKEALNILENETAFMQRKSKRSGLHMRGSLTAH